MSDTIRRFNRNTRCQSNRSLRLDDNPAYDQLVSRVLQRAVRRTIPMPAHPFAHAARIAARREHPVIVRP